MTSAELHPDKSQFVSAITCTAYDAAREVFTYQTDFGTFTASRVELAHYRKCFTGQAGKLTNSQIAFVMLHDELYDGPPQQVVGRTFTFDVCTSVE